MPPINADEIAQQRHQFNMFNIERIFSAMALFDDNESAVFCAVPLLLHRNYAGIEGLIHNADSPCGIMEFTPKGIHMEAFRKLFPHAVPEKPCDGQSFFSLALIGSLGTVAQTRKSDFDYVIFLDKKAMPQNRLIALKRKLIAIERWIHANLKVETHFFIQDADDFLHNRFGATDKENVGTALGRLFKDEFYRTAIWVAGKKPLWWIIPPGFPEGETAALYQKLRNTPGTDIGQYLDLGHILYAEPDEFFGAALWQMNKAIGSPFKSLLKMGLLESYLFNPKPGLLCEELKRRVIGQNAALHSVDPYLMMFERASGYYAEHGMNMESNLMKGAFLLKTGVMPEEIRRLLLRKEVEPGTREYKIIALLHKWGWTGEEADELNNLFAGNPQLRFRSLGHIYKYFLQTYVRLSDWLKRAGATSHYINTDDMTVLGRKLFTHFERTPGKINFVSDPAAKHKPPERLTLIREKLSEDSGIWSLYENTATAVDSGTLNPVIRFDSITEMLGWMAINGVWRPEAKFYFKGGKTQYKAEDITAVLREMHAFFGPGPHYEPTRDDYLSSRMVLKAFVMPNFGLWDTPKEVQRVDMLLMDTWGEFRRERVSGSAALAEVAQMASLAERLDLRFQLKVVAPPSQHDPHLSEEFLHMMEKAKDALDPETVSFKKATLDLS